MSRKRKEREQRKEGKGIGNHSFVTLDTQNHGNRRVYALKESNWRKVRFFSNLNIYIKIVLLLDLKILCKN